MSALDTRSKAIIDAAEKAVENIQNPAQRAEAKSRLDATLNKLEAARQRSYNRARSPAGREWASDRDRELDR